MVNQAFYYFAGFVFSSCQLHGTSCVLLMVYVCGELALRVLVGARWWNPAAEMQAIDRTHRLGQFKPIYATRFIIEDTVEERIIKLQVRIGCALNKSCSLGPRVHPLHVVLHAHPVHVTSTHICRPS